MEHTETQHINLDLVARAAPMMFGGGEDVEGYFAPDFVFHFVNSKLPDLVGDYHGLDGVRARDRRSRCLRVVRVRLWAGA